MPRCTMRHASMHSRLPSVVHMHVRTGCDQAGRDQLIQRVATAMSHNKACTHSTSIARMHRTSKRTTILLADNKGKLMLSESDQQLRPTLLHRAYLGDWIAAGRPLGPQGACSEDTVRFCECCHP